MLTGLLTLTPISTQDRCQAVNGPVSISKSIIQPEFTGSFDICVEFGRFALLRAYSKLFVINFIQIINFVPST